MEIYSGNTRWTALIGTNGKLLNRFVQDEGSIPELIFDDSMNLSAEEKQELIKKREENIKAINAVNTWNVATFWSVQKQASCFYFSITYLFWR